MAHHHHHHHHAHGHAQANEEFFDKHTSDVLSSDEGRTIGRQAAQAFLEALPFDKESTVVLDFACGIGNISLNLAPHSKSIIGVDISGGMVNHYNEMAQKEGLSDKISAVRADILADPSALGDKVFDVIVCSLSYHHFTSPSDMTRALARFLRPGGHLLVVDFLAAPKGIHDDPEVRDIVAHGSFSEEDMRSIYEEGNIELEKYTFAFDMTFRGSTSKCFSAVGKKRA